MVFLPEALEGVPGCTFGRPVVFLARFWSNFGWILELFWRDFATKGSWAARRRISLLIALLWLALPCGIHFALERPIHVYAQRPISVRAEWPIPVRAERSIPVRAERSIHIRAERPIPIRAEWPIPVYAERHSPKNAIKGTADKKSGVPSSGFLHIRLKMQGRFPYALNDRFPYTQNSRFPYTLNG